MEAIGRVRKVKKKVKDGLEKIVEKVSQSWEEKDGNTEDNVDIGPPVQEEERAEVINKHNGRMSLNDDVNIATEGAKRLEVNGDTKV